MSRSFKKKPIFGNCKGSEKEDKQEYNRKLRKKVKSKIKDTEDSELPILKEISDPWEFKKDGKHYRKNATKEDMRK